MYLKTDARWDISGQNVMKIQSMFAVAVVALALVAIPAEAQTGKDKRAAKKEKWEMEQRHQKEESELRHQQRMDSIANADKARKEAAARAEEQRRAEEEEAKAEAKRQAAEKAAQEVDLDEPCIDANSTDTYLRARGIGESLQQQSARTKAQTIALRDLGGKINVAVKSVLRMYTNDESTDMMTDETSATGMYIEEKMENMVKQVVDQNLRYSTPCEKTRTYMKNNRKIYKCYMIVQVGMDDMLKPIYNQIQKENSIRLKQDYENFKEEFEKEFEKQE